MTGMRSILLALLATSGPAWAQTLPAAPPISPNPFPVPGYAGAVDESLRTADYGVPTDLGREEDQRRNFQLVNHAIPSLPVQPMEYQRFYQPTPAQGYHYNNVPFTNMNTRPASTGVGVRLDRSYNLIRNVELGAYPSEHQHAFAAGVTFLPFQAPCWIVGVRGLAVHRENLSVFDDFFSGSVDAFAGFRYKDFYWKTGYFLDGQNEFMKTGLATGMLVDLPLVGTWTFDGSFAFGLGDDQFRLPRGPGRGQLTRVETADFDGQFRIGHFFTPKLQMGVTGNYYDFTGANDEWGAGMFVNLWMGWYDVSLDFTGGDEGIRGFATISYNWGRGPHRRPHDCESGVDTPSWITKVPMRDVNVKARQSFTGPVNMPLTH